MENRESYFEHYGRRYVRTSRWNIAAKMSKDARQWTKVEVPNIAAGGLLFQTDKTFAIEDIVWFDLEIEPMMMGLMGTLHIKKQKAVVVADRGAQENMNSYAVEFLEMSEKHRISLDELIHLTNTRFGK